MRVPGDKEFRRVRRKPGAYGRIVASRVASNMCDQYIHSLERETESGRVSNAGGAIVDIAMDCPERLHLFETGSQFEGADISRVPYFVARVEISLVFIVPVAVGIGQ